MSGLPEKLFERAMLCAKVKDWDGGLRVLTECIRFAPNMHEAWILRGNICMLQERHLDAALHYERALQINENLPDAWNNLANSFACIGMFEGARDAFMRALQAKDSWEPYTGMGNMFCTAMDLQNAEAAYKKALEKDNSPERHFQLGCVRMGLGNWREGFPGYAYRWLDTPFTPMARNTFPQWQGESLKDNKTLLLYPDQGYGDEIMTMRFATREWLPEGRIILQTRSALASIARHSLGVEVIPLHGPIPRADYACSTMDMPMVLGLEWDKVSGPPYLFVDPRHDLWDRRLPQGFNVGVCWMSGGHYSTTLSIQRSKSLRVEMLRAFKQPGVNLISLQKPIMERVPADLELIDVMDQVDDFMDTAALIGHLDLVISVDTAVAHLAGAMGVPVWNLVRFSGYWPWLAPDICGPDRSIWYPSMKLYRQPRGADWEQPVQRIAKDLEALRADADHQD
jgi:hypothetical protein